MSTIAHHALGHDLPLKETALQLGLVDEKTFDRAVNPTKMVRPNVTSAP
jgi:fumarate hydratase, class II